MCGGKLENGEEIKGLETLNAFRDEPALTSGMVIFHTSKFHTSPSRHNRLP